MLSVLIKYLIAKLETFEYLDKVHGLSTTVQVGDETMPAVYSGNELVHVNFDSYDSLVYIQQNGKIGRETNEHPAVACKYNVVERYPLRLIVYSQGKENVNCESYSQQIADSIKAALNGKQQTLETAANLTNATIILGDTDLDKNSVWQTQFSSPNQLKDSDILIAIDLEFEIEGDDTCFANNPCENSEFVFDLGTQTFCERVDACLDIPTDNGQYVLTITDNVISWDEYSPSGQVVISKTQAEFLALVSGSTLQFPAVYKITDIKNGLFVETLSANTFKPEATLSFLAPDYTLHGQYHTTDGAIANGSIVTWGGFYWQNTSGGAVTPDLPDEVNIDSNGALFTKLSKSVANGYVPILLNVIVDTSLDIVKATDEYNNSIEIKSDAYTYQKVTIDNYQWNLSATGFYNNEAFISNNVLESGGKIISNQTIGGTFIKRNKIDSTSAIVKNTGLGNDFQVSEINNCIVSNLGFISQNELHLSYIKDTNVDGGGSGSAIDECHLTNISFIDGCSISGSDCYFASCWFDRESGLQNVTINTNNTAINCVELYDQTIIENFTLPSGGQVRSYISNHSVDLTGFSKAFSQNNENGCGSFTEEIDFGASNLTSGSSLLLNLIPNGARLTMLSASGTLTGANIEIGLETDDEAIISGAVGLLPLEWSGASIAATANRSLKIKATGGDITAGALTVKVEFVV